ncbi:MAG: DUF2254 family protein [Hymenobacter sp.]
MSLGRHRNPEQDVAFGLQQLVDIALKALSPAVNDTTTAIMAIDYLGELVGRLAHTHLPRRPPLRWPPPAGAGAGLRLHRLRVPGL